MSWLKHSAQCLGREAGQLGRGAAGVLRLDLALGALLILYFLLWVPPITRLTSNPLLLNSYIIDEAMITQQLVGMQVRPYGNPANYMAHWDWVPPEWGTVRFFGVYYGGFYLDLGLVILWPLHLLGVPDFPAAPIILRSLSILSGALCLVILYNFARRNFGRVAACGSALLLLTEPTFAYFCPIVHPDTLQMALVLLALWVAQVHVEGGDLRSLLLLGALAGLVQGTKFAGIWLIPLSCVAVLWALQRRAACAAGWRAASLQVLGRFTLLGLAAGVCYVLSTPYAFLDPWYFHHWRLAWKVYQQPGTDTSLARWWQELVAHEGQAVLYLALVGLALLPWRCLRREKPVALVLSAVLLVTVSAWMLLSSRVWVSLAYGLPALALAGLFAAELLSAALHFLTRLGMVGRVLRAGLCLGTLWYGAFFPRAVETVQYALGLYNREMTTDLQFHAWALEHLPREGRIFIDTAAYLNPAQFPQAKLHGGLVTYEDLHEYKADYLVLSGSLYNVPAIKEKRKNEVGNRLFTVYQDLLDRGDRSRAELIGTVAAPPSEAVSAVMVPHLPYVSLLCTKAREVFGDPRVTGDPVLVFRLHRQSASP